MSRNCFTRSFCKFIVVLVMAGLLPREVHFTRWVWTKTSWLWVQFEFFWKEVQKVAAKIGKILSFPCQSRFPSALPNTVFRIGLHGFKNFQACQCKTLRPAFYIIMLWMSLIWWLVLGRVFLDCQVPFFYRFMEHGFAFSLTGRNLSSLLFYWVSYYSFWENKLFFCEKDRVFGYLQCIWPLVRRCIWVCV